MSPIRPSVLIPTTFHHALHDLTVFNFVYPLFKPDLRRRLHDSKEDLNNASLEAQIAAQEYTLRLGKFLKRVPVHLNLVPDGKLRAENIKSLSDEQLAVKYRTIRLSVSSAITGTLINIILIPFLPCHTVGAILNGWQTAVTLVNRHNAKTEILKRMAASETSAQILVIQLDGSRGRAKDVCVGMFFKGFLIGATMGFVDICALPANADSLLHPVHGMAPNLASILSQHTSAVTEGAAEHGSHLAASAALHAPVNPAEATSHNAPDISHAPLHPDAPIHQAADQHLKASADHYAANHPLISHLNGDTGGMAADALTRHLDAFNGTHYGVYDAPSDSSSFADLLRIHQEGVPASVIVAEVASLGAVAEGANLPAVAGDVIVEHVYEGRREKAGKKKRRPAAAVAAAGGEKSGGAAVVTDFNALITFEFEKGERADAAGPSWSPVPSPSAPEDAGEAGPSPSPSPSAGDSSPKHAGSVKRKPLPVQSPFERGFKRRRAGEDTVFMFK